MASDLIALPASPPFDPEAIPEEAVLARDGSHLRLTWRDGTRATLPAAMLRLRCRCAWCTRDRVEGRFPAAFGGVTLTGVQPIGSYAVNPTFSDGHARGIFPWLYLRQIAEDAPHGNAPVERAA